jgi:uncharacterized surface protein with fasciclin (FAS1) repeats
MRFRFFALFYLPLLALASQEQQIIMNNNPVLSPVSPKPTLADLLTIEPSASIFYSYARELELSARFADGSATYTLFVPTNKAIMALARKPHQGPTDDGVKISEEEFDRQSKRNVERWVTVHIVPEYPIALESRHDTLLHGKSITFTSTDKESEWSRVTVEDGIRIIGMKEGLNGVLYLIDGAISPD